MKLLRSGADMNSTYAFKILKLAQRVELPFYYFQKSATATA